MKNTILKLLNEHKNKKIIISVSGGVDSLVLFYLMHELNFDLVLVHFNHQQREASKEEALYLKDLTSNLNVPFEYFILDIEKDFHHEAHNLRRKHLIEVANKYQTNVILTAHHANDLLESILIKVARGSNLLGYGGMNESYFKDGFYFYKPLLTFSKNEIINYATSHNINYFEDESNYENDYLRNQIRNILLKGDYFPLEKINQYSSMLNDAFGFIRKTSILFLNEKNYFMVSDFLKLDKIIKLDVLSYLLEKEKITFNYNKLMGIINFIEKAGPNKSYQLTNEKEFIKVYNKVYITKISKEISFDQQLEFDSFNVLPNGMYVEFSKDFAFTDGLVVNLCYNNNALPLFARKRKAGDILHFHYGHKKLKDFYIDKKIPLSERNKDVVIADSNGEILAVLGRYQNNKEFDSKIQLRFGR